MRETLALWGREHLGGFAGGGRVRLLAAESLHATLCFLGGRPASDVHGIAAACRAAVAGGALSLGETLLLRETLSLGETLSLPPRRPRVVAVRLLDSGGALGRLQAELSRALQAGGWYEPERRPFNPHITVARLARGRGEDLPELPPPQELSFAACAVTLYRSHTGPGGARYEPLERIALGVMGRDRAV